MSNFQEMLLLVFVAGAISSTMVVAGIVESKPVMKWVGVTFCFAVVVVLMYLTSF